MKKVKIKVNRITTYSSIVEMPDERFDQIKTDLESLDRKIRRDAEKSCDRLIDTRDWQDDDFESVEEFEEFKEDKTT